MVKLFVLSSLAGIPPGFYFPSTVIVICPSVIYFQPGTFLKTLIYFTFSHGKLNSRETGSDVTDGIQSVSEK